MSFYIATRNQETKAVVVEHYLFTDRKSATTEAAEFAARNNLLRRNVIVVEADNDGKALEAARVTFKRGG